MDGSGKMIWEDNRKYEGQFKNDMLHGKGEMTWPDGRKYNGEW